MKANMISSNNNQKYSKSSDSFGDEKKLLLKQISVLPKNIGRDLIKVAIDLFPDRIVPLRGKDGLENILVYQNGKFSNLQQDQARLMEEVAEVFEWYAEDNAEILEKEELALIDKIVKRFVEDPPWTRVLIKAASIPEIRVDAKVFNSNPDTILFKNGVTNLLTGAIREATPQDLFSLGSDAEYGQNVPAPEFERVVSEIFQGDEEGIRTFQKAVGSTLSAETPEYIFFFIGKGANGKSLMTDILMAALGEYATPAPSSIIVKKSYQHISNDQHVLMHKRLGIITEVPANAVLDEHSIKAVIATRTSISRGLYKEFERVDNTANIIVSLNEMPSINDFSQGLYRRMMVFEFNESFLGREDFSLYDRLVTKELPGIVRWLVEGNQAFRKEGLKPTLKMQQALDHYIALADPMYAFVKECIVMDPKAKTWTKDILIAYRTWESSAHQVTSLSDQKIYLELSKRFLAQKSKSGESLYRGLRLKSDDSSEPEEF
jgi:P4 family phage/plasmid primase-like protien